MYGKRSLLLIVFLSLHQLRRQFGRLRQFWHILGFSPALIGIHCHNLISKMSNQSVKEKFVLPKRFRKIPENVWSEFTALDKKYNPVNMGQGFSDAPPPQFVHDALNATINNPNYLLNQYARAAVRFNRHRKSLNYLNC